jgi:DNA-directed RNA polymerase specialized sigma24 family protein
MSHVDMARERAAWGCLLAATSFSCLRDRLRSFFERRGLGCADDLADETIARVVARLAAGETPRRVEDYVLGTARRVALEAARRAARFTPLEDVGDAGLVFEQCTDDTTPDTEDDELARCLDLLPDTRRELMLGYYRGAGAERAARRRELAAQLGIGANALRIRVHRLRAELRAGLVRA